MPQEAIEQGVAAGKLFLQAPVPYFEAKPQRAVGLSEFPGAVIPSTASPNVRQALEKRGVKVYTYNKKREGSQRLKVRQALRELDKSGQQVYFQVQKDDGTSEPIGKGPKGSVEFSEAAEEGTAALIRGLESPDVSTGVHELAHVARRFLLNRDVSSEFREGISDEDIDSAERWAGAKDGAWNRGAEEKFARGFERYMQTGRAPTKRLEGIFSQFKDWLTRIYSRLAGSPIDIQISDEMRTVFDRLVSRRERTEAGLPGSLVEAAKMAGVDAQVRRRSRTSRNTGSCPRRRQWTPRAKRLAFLLAITRTR